MLRVVGLLGLFVLSACTQVQVEHQSDSFNRASANTIGEHTLLNVVRSSLDLPMSFTKLQKFTAGSMAKGTLAPIASGALSPRIFDLGPTINWSGGVDTIEYADVNNSGALAKLNQSLQYDTVDRYFNQGVNPWLVRTILTDHVEIDRRLLEAMERQRKVSCPDGSQLPLCKQLRDMEALCLKEWPTREDIVFTLKGGYQVAGFNNRASSRCAFLQFQAFGAMLQISGYWSDLVIDKVIEKRVTPENKVVEVPKDIAISGVRFEAPLVQDEYDRLEQAFNEHENKIESKSKGTKKSKNRAKSDTIRPPPPLKFSLRSPKSLLTYLGELVALQNFGQHRYVPEIILSGGKRMIVFRVDRGNVPVGQVAVSVRSPDGEVYTVPRPDYGDENRDQTLRVLAIAGKLVNGAISEKDFPAPASIVVRAFQ